ncbi:AAA family ATPase [Virgibacillus sp. W0181]|uniref:AAA family ATPase n=1 Tax=Virgibacillus sp. W0181 TaxID=3391581 RepID=UPI003F4793B1
MNIAHEQLHPFSEEMAKVVIGREKEFKLLITALLTGGHVLFEDLPGIGKTTMVKAFAQGIDSKFSRIQCTPDLLPSDVLGGSIFNPKTNDFYLKKGPVFTNVLLVDEINRALPRTQSSLLECMEEAQVTIEGETYPLTAPFIVLATQNPVDMEGTFPLPEAQMDRFLMKINLGYPSQVEEAQMLAQVGDEVPFEKIEAVFQPDRIEAMQKCSQQVKVHPSILDYITQLAQQTRNHALVSVGVSPRASKALYKTVKAWAFLNGRDYVTPDDVKEMVLPVWNHRLILRTEARINDTTTEEILTGLLEHVEVPQEQVIRG